jgi:hypothetical protein
MYCGRKSLAVLNGEQSLQTLLFFLSERPFDPRERQMWREGTCINLKAVLNKFQVQLPMEKLKITRRLINADPDDTGLSWRPEETWAREAVLKGGNFSCRTLGCTHRFSQLLIVQIAQKGECKMNPCRINPAKSRTM